LFQITKVIVVVAHLGKVPLILKMATPQQRRERDSLKVNVFCVVSEERVYGRLFFVENTVTCDAYVDVLILRLLLQLEEHSNVFIFQQDGAPSRFYMAVLNHLNVHLPRRIGGRAGASGVVWCRWPPTSPDLTPYDFLWVYVKAKCSSRLCCTVHQS
jgi:hypothetical protein